MNDKDYIDALKRALSLLDGDSRDEILREIRSHMHDAADGETLQARFGPVEELAEQYLDGQSLPARPASRLAGYGKATLVGVGAFTLVCILLVTVLVFVFSGDRFDYTDESEVAAEVGPSEWNSHRWSGPVTLEIDQAHTVIYWHQAQEIRWHCKGRHELQPEPGAALRIRHGFCLLYLPPQDVKLKVSQGDVVLIRPAASVEAGIHQASLRIAPDGGEYLYDFELTDSESADFESTPAATLVLQVVARESSIARYEYN